MYNFVTGKAVDQEPLKIKTDNRPLKCKLSCCNTCSYCARALPKERAKSRVSRLLFDKEQIKICQRCFLCHSIVLCKSCNKCPKCCHKPTRKQAAHKLSGPKTSLIALKEFQDLCTDKIVLVATDNTIVVSYINKEGGMRSGPLCALLWRILTWCTRHQVTLKVQHIPDQLNVVADKLSQLGQTIQSEWSLLQEVFQAICNRWHRPQIDLFAMRFNNKLPLFVSPVPDPLATAVDALSLPWEDLDTCLPSSSHLGQSGGEVAGLPLQENHSDCSGVAQHALVLGPSDHVQSDPTESALLAQPVNTTVQSDSSQKSDKPKSPCMAPRATAIEEQGISEALAARIEAPQRGSTRSVYEAKWTIFTKWCITNQVDFRAPPVKSVADFLLYLFEDRKLQPSTIHGYRSAIADKLGNLPFNISKDENLTHLLDSFHTNTISLPLEVTQQLHLILPQGCGLG